MSDKYIANYTVSAIQYTSDDELTLKSIGAFINGTAIHHSDNSILVISHDGENCFELNTGDYLARIVGVYLVIPAEIFEECFTKVE